MADAELRSRFGLRPLEETPRAPGEARVAERVALGQLLFYDPILAGERDVSCGTCHHPAFAFADGRALSVGVSGTGVGPARTASLSAVTGQPIGAVPRNAPTVMNAAMNVGIDGRPSHLGIQFWDGRVDGLEEQARGPITSRDEMAGDAYPSNVARDSVVARLRAIPEYVDRFRSAFPDDSGAISGGAIITMDRYGRAIAAFERELVTRNSPFDRYAAGEDGALTEEQKQGLELFFTTARCSLCHAGPMFSDFRFHVLGVPQQGPGKTVIPGDDAGREEHTGDPADRHAFRTPTLRNVELTAPYMHDGVFTSLEEVVLFYQRGAEPRHPGVAPERIDPLVRETLPLTDDEVRAVVAFLQALTDRGVGLDPALLAVPSRVPSGLTPVNGVRASSSESGSPPNARSAGRRAPD